MEASSKSRREGTGEGGGEGEESLTFQKACKMEGEKTANCCFFVSFRHMARLKRARIGNEKRGKAENDPRTRNGMRLSLVAPGD